MTDVLQDNAIIRPVDRYNAAVLSHSPLAYWKMKEASGTAIVDEIGSNDLTAESSVTFGSTSLLADAVTTCITIADAANNDIVKASPSGLAPAANQTIEAWINLTNLDANGRIFVDRVDADNFCYIEILSNGTIRAAWELVTVGVTKRSAASEIVTGTTYHIAATFDGTTVLVYKNGVDVSSASGGIVPGIDATLSIGSDGDGSSQAVGRIDEVALYGSVLTAPQLLFNHAAGV